jgi:four helix bundle protein
MNERAEDLKRRTKKFALDVIALSRTFPPTDLGRTIGGQLVRSATSVGANYRAACRARSRAEFIAKVGLVEEEADESSFWLEISEETGLTSRSAVEALMREANELTAICVRSITTARQSQ